MSALPPIDEWAIDTSVSHGCCFYPDLYGTLGHLYGILLINTLAVSPKCTKDPPKCMRRSAFAGFPICATRCS